MRTLIVALAAASLTFASRWIYDFLANNGIVAVIVSPKFGPAIAAAAGAVLGIAIADRIGSKK